MFHVVYLSTLCIFSNFLVLAGGNVLNNWEQSEGHMLLEGSSDQFSNPILYSGITHHPNSRKTTVNHSPILSPDSTPELEKRRSLHSMNPPIPGGGNKLNNSSNFTSSTKSSQMSVPERTTSM